MKKILLNIFVCLLIFNGCVLTKKDNTLMSVPLTDAVSKLVNDRVSQKSSVEKVSRSADSLTENRVVALEYFSRLLKKYNAVPSLLVESNKNEGSGSGPSYFGWMLTNKGTFYVVKDLREKWIALSVEVDEETLNSLQKNVGELYRFDGEASVSATHATTYFFTIFNNEKTVNVFAVYGLSLMNLEPEEGYDRTSKKNKKAVANAHVLAEFMATHCEDLMKPYPKTKGISIAELE